MSRLVGHRRAFSEFIWELLGDVTWLSRRTFNVDTAVAIVTERTAAVTKLICSE